MTQNHVQAFELTTTLYQAASYYFFIKWEMEASWFFSGLDLYTWYCLHLMLDTEQECCLEFLLSSNCNTLILKRSTASSILGSNKTLLLPRTQLLQSVKSSYSKGHVSSVSYYEECKTTYYKEFDLKKNLLFPPQPCFIYI